MNGAGTPADDVHKIQSSREALVALIAAAAGADLGEVISLRDFINNALADVDQDLEVLGDSLETYQSNALWHSRLRLRAVGAIFRLLIRDAKEAAA